MNNKVEEYIEKETQKEWTDSLEEARGAAEEVLLAIRRGNSVDIRPLYRALAIKKIGRNGESQLGVTTGGNSEYGIRIGMLEHLIFTLIEVRDSHARAHAHERTFADGAPDSIRYFKSRIKETISERLLDSLLKGIDPPIEDPKTITETITVTGQNIVVKEEGGVSDELDE